LAAAADADPVTRLVLGWLAAKRSENTRAAYARDIGIIPGRRSSRAPSWLAWCQAQGVDPVTGVTGLHVVRYARRLEVVGLAPATAARKLAAVSGWYAWLVRRGHLEASPAADIPRPRRAAGDPPATPRLTRDQAVALARAADTAPGPQRARTAALMAVLLLTGVRVGEVIAADVADLGTDRRRRVLWVTRNEERYGLPLPAASTVRLDAYLAGRPGDRTGPLFATSTGGRLFPADVSRVVHRLAARAGLPADLARHLGPHAMRCSFAGLYLDAGGSLRDLQNALGHADPRTTRRYDRGPDPDDSAPGDRAPGDLVAAYLADPASGARRDPGRLRRGQ
jgi:integrase/recombinase XerD